MSGLNPVKRRSSKDSLRAPTKASSLRKSSLKIYNKITGRGRHAGTQEGLPPVVPAKDSRFTPAQYASSVRAVSPAKEPKASLNLPGGGLNTLRRAKSTIGRAQATGDASRSRGSIPASGLASRGSRRSSLPSALQAAVASSSRYLKKFQKQEKETPDVPDAVGSTTSRAATGKSKAAALASSPLPDDQALIGRDELPNDSPDQRARDAAGSENNTILNPPDDERTSTHIAAFIDPSVRQQVRQALLDDHVDRHAYEIDDDDTKYINVADSDEYKILAAKWDRWVRWCTFLTHVAFLHERMLMEFNLESIPINSHIGMLLLQRGQSKVESYKIRMLDQMDKLVVEAYSDNAVRNLDKDAFAEHWKSLFNQESFFFVWSYMRDYCDCKDWNDPNDYGCWYMKSMWVNIGAMVHECRQGRKTHKDLLNFYDASACHELFDDVHINDFVVLSQNFRIAKQKNRRFAAESMDQVLTIGPPPKKSHATIDRVISQVDDFEAYTTAKAKSGTPELGFKFSKGMTATASPKPLGPSHLTDISPYDGPTPEQLKSMLDSDSDDDAFDSSPTPTRSNVRFDMSSISGARTVTAGTMSSILSTASNSTVLRPHSRHY